MIANDLINMALRASGILGTGQTAPAEMTNQALTALNMILRQWSAKRWLDYRTTNLTLTSTGALSYTVGPGGDFDIPRRPQSVEAAFISMNSGAAQIDIPIEVYRAREDYNAVALKSLVTMPSGVFYDNAMPLGVAYFWPVPNAARYSMTLTVKNPLLDVTDILADMGLPPEFDEALTYSLAVRMRTLYQLAPDAGVVALARAGIGTIRSANAQVARLRMPVGLSHGGRYNIFSDGSR